MKMIYRLITVFLALVSLAASAETLTQYIQACEAQLGFDAGEVPALNCNNGTKFADLTLGGIQSPVNDFVGYQRINDNVDLAFACRWLSGEIGQSIPFNTAVSVEMIIHNPQNGQTCFFAAKPQPSVAAPDGTVFLATNDSSGDLGGLVSTAIVSPTDSNASSYWMQPADLDSATFHVAPLRCVGCHVAGPYIASPRIAPMLATFGLLNNGHDTFGTRYQVVGSNAAGTPTNAPGDAFKNWNTVVANANVQGGCSSGCHSIGSNSTAGSIFGPEFGFSVIPSLQSDIQDIITAGVMPANASNVSVYRWVNMSTPSSGRFGGESEILSDLKRLYPKFYCSNPIALQAHVVGSTTVFDTRQIKDNLNRFNLQDGLVCLNADQSSGRCNDYQTRYLCGNTWTPFRNLDTPGSSGDWEPRRSFPGLCASPTAIQAEYLTGTAPSQFMFVVNGPPDRLAEFDTNGLVCNNLDQSNGQCSNYVVRFICPQ